MNEPKFTKGDWFVGTSKNVGDILVYSKRPNYEQLVAQIVCQAEDTEPNAALIAAAPDLYKVLTDARQSLVIWIAKAGHFGKQYENDPVGALDWFEKHPANRPRAIQEIDDALAKARGEKP